MNPRIYNLMARTRQNLFICRQLTRVFRRFVRTLLSANRCALVVNDHNVSVRQLQNKIDCSDPLTALFSRAADWDLNAPGYAWITGLNPLTESLASHHQHRGRNPVSHRICGKATLSDTLFL